MTSHSPPGELPPVFQRHPLPQPMGFLFPIYLLLVQIKFSYLCRILLIFSLRLNNIELKCALGRTIIQLAILNVRYCSDDPGTLKDIQAIENWMNNQESGEGLIKATQVIDRPALLR